MSEHITKTEDFESFKDDTMIKLDLACGNAKRKGFLGVDLIKTDKTDIVHDLNKYPYPFENNSIYEIHCSHFVEHVADLRRFMEECYRILMNQSIITILAPYYTSVRAIQDFNHIRFISEFTFNYFNKEWLKAANIDHYDIKCNFSIESMKYFFDPSWVTRSEDAKEWARLHYNNVVQDIEVILRKQEM